MGADRPVGVWTVESDGGSKHSSTAAGWEVRRALKNRPPGHHLTQSTADRSNNSR